VCAEFVPKATNPKPVSADLRLIVDQSMDQVIITLQTNDVAVEEGPVQRTAVTGPIQSVYFRDPDGNLIETSI
jgi:catechol 2,3-dioxygenase-like lactoylglutathione lyase family enzyme